MSDSISIVFAGDFCPTQHVESAVNAGLTASDILGPVVDRFQRSDFSIVNLEYPLTETVRPLVKFGSHQKGHPKTIAVLKSLGVDLVTLANNHILDYGEQGLEDTLSTCQGAGIATVGAGTSLEEAQKPYCVTLKGRSFAFLGVCENEFSVARRGRGGAFGLDLITLHGAITSLKAQNDFVIVSFHGGSEFTHYPSPETIRICHYMIDCGASSVVCHHPHYIQGIEYYKDAPILYSLGKLFYTKMTDSGLLEIPVATFTIPANQTKISVDFEFYKTSLRDMCLVTMEAAEQSELKKRFAEYSSALPASTILKAEWDAFCERRKLLYLSILLGVPSWVMRVLRRLRLTGLIDYYARWKRKELLTLENFVRCESHREAVLSILERKKC